jgi:tRNA threonylcarbamoyladenosine biosynthesis protein TsaB
VLTLALDTSSDSGSVAILREEGVIGVISTSAEETYSSRIFRQLEFLLAELSLGLESCDLLAVNAGPGSFTGLRVGLTLGKAWSEVHGKPIAPVGGLEAVAAQCVGATAKWIIPALDARRGQLYAGLYRHELEGSGAPRLFRETDDAVFSPQQFLAWIAELPGRTDAIVATPARAWLAGLLAASGMSAIGAALPPIYSVSKVLAPTIGLLGREKFLRRETVDALWLDANYVRRTDAETNWKGK